VEPSEHDFIAHSFHKEVVYTAVEQRLQQASLPTAIFAGNDGIALAALQAARDLGRRVPEDIAVIGYDDWPIASYMTPGLTTIRQPMHEIGEAVVQGLANLIEKKSVKAETRVKRFPPTLIIRDST
jgi:DNA-binding LacI/PurR family transcriptional regulator